MVLIDMEMPERCVDCACYQVNSGLCGVLNVYACHSDGRHQDCPLVGLPKGHGRLIDGDELASGCDEPYWCRWLSEIEDAPTIVPAEKEKEEEE